MFNFNFRYAFDKKHIVVDDLSRQSHELSNDIDQMHKKIFNKFIDNQFNCMQMCSMRLNEKRNEQFLNDEYSKKFLKIVYYLITLTRFNYLNRKKFYKFKDWALQFSVRNKHLFRQINKTFRYKKLSIKQRINQFYWNNFKIKIIIASAKEFINA